MARISGTVPEKDVRNLNDEARKQHLTNLQGQCLKLYGPGIFNTVSEQNGDISYTYDYAEAFTLGHGSHGGHGLSEEQLAAIAHGRTALANLGGVHMQGEEWVASSSHADDPAVPVRVTSLNILEVLLAPHGLGSHSER